MMILSPTHPAILTTGKAYLESYHKYILDPEPLYSSTLITAQLPDNLQIYL
jgi:hypothetical protein